MMAAVHNNNSNQLQCHEHVQLVASYRHGNTPTVRSPVAPHTLENSCFVCVCLGLLNYWVVTLTMHEQCCYSHETLWQGTRNTGIDLPKIIMVLMYITNPIHLLTNHPFTTLRCAARPAPLPWSVWPPSRSPESRASHPRPHSTWCRGRDSEIQWNIKTGLLEKIL